MNEWLDNARRRLAEAVGEQSSVYQLTEKDVDDLLDLARVAAHEGGERTNAPLLTYLVGVAKGRHPDRALADLVDDVVGEQR